MMGHVGRNLAVEILKEMEEIGAKYNEGILLLMERWDV
jgi:hypothetical protein